MINQSIVLYKFGTKNNGYMSIKQDIQQQKDNKEVQSFKNYRLVTQKQQNGNAFLLIGKQNTGKSHFILQTIQLLKGANSRIFYFTSLSKKYEEEKLRQKIKDIEIIVFDEQDIKNNIIYELHKQLDKEYEEYQEWKKVDIKQLEKQLKDNRIDDKQKYQLNNQIQQYYQMQQIFKDGKYNYTRNFIVFDDIIVNQKDQQHVLTICRFVRHYFKTVVFYSIQDLTIIEKKQRNCFQVLVIFPGLSKDRLDDIYQQQKSTLEKDDFLSLYYYQTKQPYSYIIINSFYYNTFFQCSDGNIYFVSRNGTNMQ